MLRCLSNPCISALCGKSLMQILSLLILKGVLYFSMCLKIWHPPRRMPFIIVIQFSLRSSADESREYNS